MRRLARLRRACPPQEGLPARLRHVNLWRDDGILKMLSFFSEKIYKSGIDTSNRSFLLFFFEMIYAGDGGMPKILIVL
jgi:hypothetical protein